MGMQNSSRRDFIKGQGDKMPEISIIVPVYKVEKYLDRCVKSILKQTFKNFELILVDDGSPDRCPKLCDAWGRRDPRIRVIHKENGGLSSARNAGLKSACGSYIGFVDSDDWIAEDMYELLYKLITEKEADYASVGVSVARSEKQIASQPESQTVLLNKRGLFERFFRVSDKEINYFVWNKLFKREIVQNIRFWEGMRFEDIDFMFKALIRSNRGVYSNQIKYFWFYNENSITRNRLVQEDMQLLMIWKRIVSVCNKKYPEYIYYARMNYERAYMGLLAKGARFGVDGRYTGWKQDKKYLLKHLRRSFKALIRWKMPLSRKALLCMLSLNPDMIAFPFCLGTFASRFRKEKTAVKLFFMGDFISNAGPGIANRLMREGLKPSKNYLYSDAKGKAGRIFEAAYKTLLADCLCVCSDSKLNIFAVRWSKLLGKPVFYIMHGYRSLEDRMNGMDANGKYLGKKDREKVRRTEVFMFKNADRIFCVSKMCMGYMKKYESKYREKFDYNYNGVDIQRFKQDMKIQDFTPNAKQIMATGGGMKRKNNITVCHAIEKLNRENRLGLTFVIAGKRWTDMDEIGKFEFVRYYEDISREQTVALMRESALFIQNSLFDTFNLSVIEAIFSGCSLLVSDKVGAAGAIASLEKCDQIYDTYDIDEIAEKIKYTLSCPNNLRLRKGITDEISNIISAKKLVEKITEYAK